MEFSRFRTDDDLRANAEWHNPVGDLRLLIARSQNTAMKEATRDPGSTALRATRSGIKIDTKNARKNDDSEKRAASRFILLDWENLEVDGTPIEYSADKAFELFRKSDQFYVLVMDFADSLNDAVMAERQDAGKNSESVFAGTSTSANTTKRSGSDGKKG